MRFMFFIHTRYTQARKIKKFIYLQKKKIIIFNRVVCTQSIFAIDKLKFYRQRICSAPQSCITSGGEKNALYFFKKKKQNKLSMV